MALQRIRLQSFAPFPSFRVWFLVPQNAVDVQSLKLAISALPVLKGLDIPPAQLVLEMDGFELLDESSIDLVREGDIIVVNAREPYVLDKLKRKVTVEKATRAPKRHRLSISSEECSRVSSSSASDPSTSDPSTSDSGTPSSSSDSDSEDPKSIPGPNVLFLPFNNKPQSKDIIPVAGSQTASRVETSGIQKPTVPPGLGKASTHSRNQRRKLKRKYAAAQSSSQAKNPILPVGVNGDEMASMEDDRQPPSVCTTPRSTIQHNNNHNDSMEAMKVIAPQKLDSNSTSVPTISGYTTTFIPPSEREVLPKNLFVTGVEINWRTNQGRTARRDANKTESSAPPDDTHAMHLFDPSLHHPSDWAAIDTAWEKYKTLDASMELLPDTIVAWKAFGLDPVTLTPQASMLHLGKVVSIVGETILVQPLTRPNNGCATFGRASMGEDQVFAEQISRLLREVWSDEWKLITHQ